MSVGPIADIDQPDAGTDGQQLLQNIAGDRLLAFALTGMIAGADGERQCALASSRVPDFKWNDAGFEWLRLRFMQAWHPV